ncbi:Short chain dehydrogenase atnD like protein [Verticillium longisporum]|uniref:Short chain dehydrogenase atnD like protein n=1 Tax=Verticillium longisporum TaxID=100787 RepID=A0A8I2ZH97_VERLO|nr:Short chain dehydrogenase atnD like protein [Verticillium longisporum]
MDFLSFIRAQWENLPILLKQEHVSGGIFIITGSNHGIGREAARHVAQLGPARVIIAVRSREKGDEAKAWIESTTGGKTIVESWILDITDFASIRAFAARCDAELDRIDGLVQNAAEAVDRFETNAQGHEISIAGNVIGTALLAVLLLSKVAATARKFGVTPHMVIVTSQMGFTTPQATELVDRGLFDALKQENLSPMSDRYAVSKLIGIILFREMAKVFPASATGTVINLISPGLCNTGLARNSHSLTWRTQVWLLNLLIGRTPEMGSRTILHAMMAEKESHGAFLSDCQIKEYAGLHFNPYTEIILTTGRHWVPDWAKHEGGEALQKGIWDQTVDVLESIEPGCVERAGRKCNWSESSRGS